MNRIIQILALITLSINVYAQSNEEIEMNEMPLDKQLEIKVVERFVVIQKESRPALSTYLEATPEATLQHWKKYMKELYDIEFLRSSKNPVKKKVYFKAEDVRLLNISEKRINIYTQVNADENGSRLDFLISYGTDVYVSKSSNPEDYAKAEDILMKFIKDFYVKYYTEMLENARKNREKIQKDYDKEIKARENLNLDIVKKNESITKHKDGITQQEKKIVEANQKIEEHKANIKSNEADIEQLKRDVIEQEKSIQSAKNTLDEKQGKIELIKSKLDSIQ